MAKRKHVFEEIDRRLQHIAASDSPTDKERGRRLEVERELNMEPLTRMFEQQLKPRLDRLPTAEQRRVVEFADDSESTKKLQ